MNTQLPTPLLVALVLWGLALLAVLFLLLGPRPEKLPMHRRRPEIAEGPGALTKATGHATALIDKILKRRGGATAAAVLEQAGVKMRLQEVVLLIVAGALVTGALGVLLTGSVLAVVVGIISPLGVRLALGMRISRRQRAFADQLDDSLQLMASSLRAGHSLLQALASVSREAEVPTADEFARIINETRVGRPLGEA